MSPMTIFKTLVKFCWAWKLSSTMSGLEIDMKCSLVSLWYHSRSVQSQCGTWERDLLPTTEWCTVLCSRFLSLLLTCTVCKMIPLFLRGPCRCVLYRASFLLCSSENFLGSQGHGNGFHPNITQWFSLVRFFKQGLEFLHWIFSN